MVEILLKKSDAIIHFLIIGTFSFFACVHAIDEILCAFNCYQLKRKIIFWRIRICDLISFILAVGILATYFALKQAWFISDVICALILFSSLKFLKLTSLRSSVYFFFPVIILDIISSIMLATFFKKVCELTLIHNRVGMQQS